ncbi:ScyD/ScyE family protein [Microlunatus ginsengisoli]|uniref:ScyD/ScyE family protein n=1 Tax=Microlunatus ginsengisoli TaxID=363863 RepID=A0ABP7AJC7_9ACTN
MRTSKIIATAAAAATGLLLIAPTVASAHPKPAPTPVVKSNQLAAPFNLALNHGNVYVADGGLNLVGKLKRDGSIKTIAADQPGASGVATSKDGRYLAFTSTVTNEDTFENTASGLNIWGPKGKRVHVDTLAYETAKNPDKINHYGINNPSQCVIDAFTAAGFPYDYTGQIDSHAYSVTSFGSKWIVADAGANTLWKIDNKGNIRTLAVLPPQPTKITADMAKALGFPDCVAGVTYNFEPVPTDVEVGKDGYLYVTTLPGGPETPVLGARGKLWKVNPYSGNAWVIASGFLGATNLAIGKHGEFYVSEFFGGDIAVVKHGKKSTYLTLPGVVAVETSKSGELWAATLGNEDPPAPGTIVKIVHGKAYKQATVKP